MRLYVARHTQTDYNVETRLNSDPSVNVQLTGQGILQAKHLAQKLAQENFDVIYISELPRTRQTADYINEYHQVPLIVDKKLNDNATGFEGKLTQEYLSALNKNKDIWHAKLNDGESLADAKNRAEAFLNELKTKPYKAVLVVTHGYIVESLYAILNNLDYAAASTYKLPQGEFAVFDM